MSRDTQFAGFARALLDELIADGSITIDRGWDTEDSKAYDDAHAIIARRAYDLVEHAMGTPQAASSVEEMVSLVPDMAELPLEEEVRQAAIQIGRALMPNPPELEPYTDPKDISYMDIGIPGYKVPIQKSVLRLRPKEQE